MAATLLATAVLVALGAGVASSFAIALGSALAAWLMLRVLRSFSFLPLFRIIYSLNKHFTVGNRGFFQQMATEVLQDQARQVEQLVAGVYTPNDLSDLQRYVEYCFKRMDGEQPTYVGIDSNLPSAYMDVYEWFLQAHEEKLDRLRPRNNVGSREGVEDCRVVIATMGNLTEDFEERQEKYLEFIRWHKRNQVRLLHMTPERAARLAPREASTLDIAYWGSLVGGFRLGETATGVRFWFLDAQDYNDYADYVNTLVRDAEPFPESPTGLTLVSPELAERWAGYIGLEHRKKIFGPFLRGLLSSLKDGGLILDAAAGVGSETVDLLKHGFAVFPNEVDGELTKQLEAYADREKVRTHVLPYSWQHLSERMENQLRFDAVLVVGNSLCMATETAHRKGLELRRECIQNFRRVLLPGGRLIVDERNFQYLLDNASDILEHPYENFAPAREGDVMYRGDVLRGFPAEIDESHVLWRFFARPSEVHDSESLLRNQTDDGGIRLHPFKCGELYSLLTSSGFEMEATYADLKPVDWNGKPPYPQNQDGGPVQFFTYVARLTGM